MKLGIMAASSQLGTKTVEALLARGVDEGDVVAIARTPSKMEDLIAQGVETRAGDYDDRVSMERAFEGIDRLLLVPTLAMPVERVPQIENAVAAARAAGVTHLLEYGLVPTTLESKFAITPYYLYAESLLRHCGLAWTSLRNSMYADPIAEWVPEIVKMGTIPYPTGDGACAFVTRDDIARTGAAALSTDGHEGKTYNLTGPKAYTTAELCEVVARVTGELVEYRPATDQDYVDACVREGIPAEFAWVLLTIYHDVRDGRFALVSDDIEKLTGQAALSFEEYLESGV
ncbi:MAG: SDR family oxidoreductase [Deltaproteobacteria bacterium]|nr:SDR family oxidoreductase [Deltaproteobacteria bacterium]